MSGGAAAARDFEVTNGTEAEEDNARPIHTLHWQGEGRVIVGILSDLGRPRLRLGLNFSPAPRDWRNNAAIPRMALSPSSYTHAHDAV